MLRASIALLLLSALATGQEKKDGTDWRDVMKNRLKPPQAEALGRQKFIIPAEETYRQVFTPYLYGDMPVFVTSDSVLNGLHVLLEESIYRLERTNAERLPGFLVHVAGRLDDGADDLGLEPKVLAAAKQRAKTFLGVAVRLHADDGGKFDEATARLMREEISRITRAEGVSKPAWLGKPDPGFVAIDYSRFRPRGFYTRSAQLERYFRIVSWLQAIPFRVDKDEELVAALILARAAADPHTPAARRGKAALQSCDRFIGNGDDWGLDVLDRTHREIARDSAGKGMLDRLRAELLKRAKEDRPQINEQLAFIPDDPTAVAEVNFRMATPYRLPDAVLLGRMADPRVSQRDWPAGLDVAAALGSPFARGRLRKDGGEALLARIDENGKSLRVAGRENKEGEPDSPYDRSTVYMKYLDCLANLLSYTEPDWPEFMKTEAWQAKTCQTALAGWSQMRHTWVLQAKLSVNYLSASAQSPGFVEPVPEFYRKLGRLCERAEIALDHAGVFEDDKKGPQDPFERELTSYLAICSGELIDILERSKAPMLGVEGFNRLPKAERDRALDRERSLRKEGLARLKTPEQFRSYLAELRKEHDNLSRKLDEGPVMLLHRWRDLRAWCSRLELLSHKQLRGREFSPEEKKLLEDYGESLARIMFYDGNSYIDPRDDAPRIVEVFASGGKFLEVGIGRPRAIYVLYPWQGREVPCHGAVLPYHEFVHDERLTDEAWRKLIKTPERAEATQPPWAKVLNGAKDR